MIKSILLTIISIGCFQIAALAQSNPRYLILFKDKNSSPFSVSKPAQFLSERSVARRIKQNIPVTINDLPVNPAYVAAIKQTGATIIYSSRWFNASLVEASATQLAAIKALTFFKGIELNAPVANLTSESPGIGRSGGVMQKLETEEDIDYGGTIAQLALMEVPDLHKKGFHGENMIVAVLDDGFNQANQVGYFKSLRDEKRIVDTHDFVARDGDVYNDGSHGLNVLSTMAAYEPGALVGAAYKASYALYRTENDLTESPYEEITWLMAAERADSLGADVINSSLGYNQFDDEFNTPAYNYTYEDMDGKTTIVSRAALFATRTGILVVVSAGNDGNKAWHFVAAPADVDSVLSVGAVNYDKSYAAFSSVGPNAAGQQKPDVAAVGAGTIIGNTGGTVSSSNGTSFSSPLIAGVCAILWQAYPNLSAQQVIDVLKKSGHQAANPDNILGYGVPDLVKAQQIIQNEFGPLGTESELLKTLVLAPNPVQNNLSLSIPQSLIGKTSHISFYGINGASLWSSEQRLSATHSVPVNSLPTGLYLIQIKVDGQQRSLKFLKQ